MTEARKLGPYELIREVGYGGMGSVFLAKREGPGRFQKRVAVKTIHPHLAKEGAFVAMFLDEARIAAAMSHPNVAQVFDLGEVDGTYFLTMEFLHGQHLGAVQQKVGRLDPRLVARIASQAARGLHHAHEVCDDDGKPMGLVHRDVSPQNIFLTYDGQVKVTDFGIARAEGRLAQTTDTGRIKGKCSYMAPEQVTSKPVDRRADLFALGVVMWELLTGERLFSSSTDAEALLKIVQGEIPPLDGPVPADLAAIVERALALNPADRFSSADELASALDAYLATAGVVSPSELVALMDTHFEERTSLQSDSKISGLADTVAATPSATPATTPPARPAPKPTGSRSRILAIAALLAVAGVATFLLWPTTSTVRIDSQPSGAQVVIDGQEAPGTTPVVIRELALGRHELALSLDGFEPLAASFDADRSSLELSYRLRQETPGAVTANENNENTAAENTNAENTNAENTNAENTAAENTAAENTAAENTAAENTAAENTAAENTAAENTAAENTGGENTGGENTGGENTAAENTASETMEEVRVSSMRIRRTPMRAAMATMEPAMEAEMDLQPVGTARLNLITQPWATVRINGRDFGRTPLYQRSIPAGALRVELRARGEGPVVRRTIRADPGATVNERVQLPE
ncbi:MAG: protein kinase [Myxococcota bacterium]